MPSDIQQTLVSLFKELHANPELSYKEHNTTKLLTDFLNQHNIEILQTGLDTGLVAIIRGKKAEPIVCVRCDIDALPIFEKSDLPYSSMNGAMHACGHDFHMASLIGVALLLKQKESELEGTVKLLFQPAEESSNGALGVIKTGVLNDVSAIFGLHVSSEQELHSIGIKTGAITAAVDRFEIDINGKGCHAARPHEGLDPIVIASQIISALQSIVSRNTNPFDQALISVTNMHAGNTWNVIPEQATLEGTVRTLNPDTRGFVRNRMEQISTLTAKAFGGNAVFRWFSGPPATDNDPTWCDFARKVAEEGHFKILEPTASLGGEDFAFYQEFIKGVFVNIGIGKTYPVHHPKFQANPEALSTAAYYLASLAEKALLQLQS